MPLPKKRGKTDPQKHELEAFAEKYDTHADIYGDPVTTLFRTMAYTQDEELRVRVAEMLMSYRYPRVKSMENTGNKVPVVQFNILTTPERGEKTIVLRPLQEMLG